MKLSATKVQKYLRCPRSYEDSYLHGNWGDPSQPAVQGKIAHEAIALGYEHKLETSEELPIEEKFNHIDLAFKEDEAKGKTNYRDLIPDVVRQTKEMVLLHHNNIAVRTDPFMIEKNFEVKVGDHDLVGIWDLISKDGWIIDNKFYSETPSQFDLDKDLQMSFYSLGYRLAYGEVEKGLRLDCVVKSKQMKTLHLTTSRTTRELEWCAELINQVATAMESGIFPPNPLNWNCDPRWCSAWDNCMHGGYTE